jgi:DNA-binding transcriptional regulator YhcF (GntR family)
MFEGHTPREAAAVSGAGACRGSILRDEIAQGTMTGRIPSVHTIAGHHQVSHRVAALAPEILLGEGMTEDVPGEGHVVRHTRT